MDDEIMKVVNSLPVSRGYDQQQRYSDFRQVFGTDQGQRVMSEIVAWGKLFRTPSLGKPVDPYQGMISIGEANVVRRLLYIYTFEPANKPGKQEKQ